ncbi:MAG: thiamine-phosphate kinase [Acidobacteriota bacterium]|nr:thiamine-phosphate kinase [Acidobacteriota bacterium]
MTVSDLGEHALLGRLLARLPRPSAQVLVGPGDDAAVLAPVRNERLVVTTDALVQGVHFSSAFSPADIGHKALAVNLSDLAAMAATPQWALLSLVLPGDWLVTDVEGLVDGLTALAVEHGVSVVGGNITRTTGPLVVDVTVGGTVASRKWLTRTGAIAGDEIWVSGTLGGARAGLEMLGSATPGVGSRESGVDPACIGRQRRPEPRVRLGVAVGRGRAARAAMDLSDGLADGIRQIGAASGCGARIDAGALPIEPGAGAWWQARGVDPVIAAVTGGEDYELLFAIPKKGGRLRNVRRHVANPAMTRIGVWLKDPGELVIDRGGRDEPLPRGYEHFAERSEAKTTLAERSGAKTTL